MTKDKKFKKVVRARMAVTGESYMAALRALEGSRPPPSKCPGGNHDLVEQGPFNEELCCTRCSFSKPNR